MKKTTLLLITGLMGLSVHAQQISNVTFAQEGQEVKVNYDFTGAGNKNYDIMLYYSQDNGTWKGPLKAVSGAVGSNQGGGYSREIRWRASEEVSALSSGHVRFKVSAKPPVDLIPTPEMVFIKGGRYIQGSDAVYNAKPHWTTLSDFWMAKTEVTVGQFAVFVKATGYITDAERGGDKYNWRHDTKGNIRPESESNHPVARVSWNDATAYCVWLRNQTGQQWRLPTEAEWEYAAGGGSSGRRNYAGTDNEGYLGNYGWYSTNSGSTTHPVGQKQPNALGLYDMSGNVWEWCSDWYGDYPSSNISNPTGPTNGTRRVGRGGSWLNGAGYCRVSDRYDDTPDYRISNLGFRPVRTP